MHKQDASGYCNNENPRLPGPWLRIPHLKKIERMHWSGDVSNEELCRWTDQPSILRIIAQRNVHFLGHVLTSHLPVRAAICKLATTSQSTMQLMEGRRSPRRTSRRLTWHWKKFRRSTKTVRAGGNKVIWDMAAATSATTAAEYLYLKLFH